MLTFTQIPTGLENPCKIAFDPDAGVLGVGFITRKTCVVGQNEAISGSFKLMDAKNFKGWCKHGLIKAPASHINSDKRVPFEHVGIPNSFGAGKKQI
jgi:hypothetical protein